MSIAMGLGGGGGGGGGNDSTPSYVIKYCHKLKHIS